MLVDGEHKAVKRHMIVVATNFRIFDGLRRCGALLRSLVFLDEVNAMILISLMSIIS